MENKNEFKENLVRMANKKEKADKSQMAKIGDNARKVIQIIKHGEKEDGR